MWESIPSLSLLEECISHPDFPIGMRMRAAYYLRHLHATSPKGLGVNDQHAEIHQHDQPKVQQNQKEEAIRLLSIGLLDHRHGHLLRHEFAYVMGQLRDEQCCDVLEQVLCDPIDNVMVRHEAAEALGAIGAERSKNVLLRILQRSDDHNAPPELVETCRLSLDVIDWRDGGSKAEEMPAVCACMVNPYSSVDPAPPHPSHENMSAQELGRLLRDALAPMFQRYRAMFSLRNKGSEDCVMELCHTLTHDQSSALLRHEVAYVLGQLQHAASVEALEESLRNDQEHSMVRHESAEALGAIEGRWQDVERILQEFSNDSDAVVRESCLVALDAADYWTPNRQEGEENCEEQNEYCGGPNPESSDPPVTFVKQKNFLDPVPVVDKKPPNRVLINHFNVES